MLSVHNLQNSLPLFRALGSVLRVQILELVYQHEHIYLKELSEMMDMPPSTLAPHIHMLEECNLLHIISSSEPGDCRKFCVPGSLDQIAIYLDRPFGTADVFRFELPVGHYSSFLVTPTCGMATPDTFVGQLDEPRYFAHPDRYQAGILWFTSGYVEYMLPNLIPLHSAIDCLTLSFEIASEAPGHNNCWPSDIGFFLNGQSLGKWTSPGDYGDRRGRQNPSWWYGFLNQYGLLKTLIIDQNGTFMDHEKISDVTTESLALTDQTLLNFRFCVSPGADARGCTLFGRGFGDYDQSILMEIHYHRQSQSS